MLVTPEPVDIRLIQDVYSNSVALVRPPSPATALQIDCSFAVEHTGTRALDLPLEPHALNHAFAYSDEDRLALQHYLLSWYDDPTQQFAAWARQFVRSDGPTGTRELLVEMTQWIRNSMRYAARFVSGYLYTPWLDSGMADAMAAGATHAWVQVFLPGAGWIPFDPTNNLIGGTDLIRVGVARHASLASPVSGSWHGFGSDFAGMHVDVQVRRR